MRFVQGLELVKLLFKNCFSSPLSILHTVSHKLLTYEMHISISHDYLECVLDPFFTLLFTSPLVACLLVESTVAVVH